MSFVSLLGETCAGRFVGSGPSGSCFSFLGSCSSNYLAILWVIPGDKADVVIEVHEYKMVQNGKPCFFTLLNYSAYTDRELRDWQQSIEQEYDF